MKSVGLARIEIDGRHVSGLRYGLDDARIGAALKNAGINTKLYAGKSEGRVLDLARQLVRMRTEAYVFHVNEASLAVTCELAAQLGALAPHARFVFWGRAPNANPAVHARAEALAAWFSEDDLPRVQEALLGLCGAVPVTDPVSPYLSGLMTAGDVARQGLALSTPALLEAELDWLDGQGLQLEKPLQIDARAATSASLLEAIAALAARNPTLDIELHTVAEACSAALFDAFPVGGRLTLVIDGGLDGLPSQAQRLAASIQPGQTESGRTARAALYGRNGNIVLHTGQYFDAKQTAGIYHLEVPLALDAEKRAEVYEWAASNMDIRSAAVLTGTSERVREQLPAFVAPQSEETRGWPKHAYALGREIDGKASMVFDGVAETAQSIRYVPMSRLAATAPSLEATTFVTMETADDVDILVRELDRLHSAGEIRLPHPRHAVYFENSCRWLNYGSCRLPLVRRVGVQPDLQLRACRDAGSIGKVGENFDRIVLNLKMAQQQDDIKRDCATCPVVSQCSHCNQLPAAWDGRYCEIRKRYAQTALYFELPVFAHLVKPLLDEQADGDLQCRISYSGLPAQYYHGPVGMSRSGSRPLIVGLASQHLLWWRGSYKLRRLSHPLALMTEAWWLGAGEDDILDALIEVFKVEREVARTSMADGMKMLREGQIIHG